eukprot:12773696-Ditylum_brightwellii.AAC.1
MGQNLGMIESCLYSSHDRGSSAVSDYPGEVVGEGWDLILGRVNIELRPSTRYSPKPTPGIPPLL